MTHRKQVSDIDGGYHAIRGFAFQFDATILEVLADPDVSVGLEGDQDIDIENFHIQIKLRSQTFTYSKVGKAIKQLIAQFSKNTNHHYRLYCHFIDQEPGSVARLEVEKLDELLGDERTAYSEETKKLFADRFEIKFAPDFETQFSAVLEQLKSRHRLRTTDEAVIYHAILNQALTTLVLSKPVGSRTITAAQLDLTVHDAERAIFCGGYQNHFGVQKYISLLRSQILGSRSVNVARRERLIIAEIGERCDVHDVVDFALAVSSRFYVRENSPQPFLLIRGVEVFSSFKQELWDAGVKFADGTHFHGDRFRLEDLIARQPKAVSIKVVDENKLPDFLAAMRLQEVYEFYSTRPMLEPFDGSRLRRMSVDSIADATKVMEVTARR